jgi:crotonobetainyl-CoA:carnitine CoA-transferase CaiB-like acyl-CoA transferase
VTDAPYFPLAGLRVVDMADEKAELAGRLLADLGADVVRVEPPGGAPTRAMPPVRGSASLWFEVRNTNKRSVVIDLDSEDGRADLEGLLSASDIWIETSRPGHLATIGLDPQEVAGRHRHLVVLSVTDFGQTGPYRDYQATDAVMSAMAWMLFRAGVVELPPVLPPGTLPYDMVGAGAALAAVTAYLDGCSSGLGQYIDMSVMEAVAQLTDWGITGYSVIRKLGLYGEVRDGGGKVYPVIPCADGFVRPAMVTVGEWRKLRAWIGEAGIQSELVQQDHWDDQIARLGAFDELLRPVFVEFFATKTMMEASVEGQKRGIPITPMLTPADAMQADQFSVLGSFTDYRVGTESGRAPSGFLLVDGKRVGLRTPAPAAGAEQVADVGWEPRPVREGDGRTDPGRPYSGLRVLEFGVAGAVPEMGRMLAEYGADVIRIETPKKPDLFRQLGGPTGMGSVFASSNRSTRSFGVDYTLPSGAELVLDLVERADVVMENLTPGTLEPYGLGVDRLRAVNPDLLIVSSQTMGRAGPWSAWRGYGSNTQLPSGMSWLWSFPDRDEPVPQNVAFPDHFVGRLGALVVAADLVARRRGDVEGHHVEIVQAEMAINLLGEVYLQESLDPGSVAPRGNRSPLGAPWGVYQCAGEQRWCVITCRSDGHWRGLVAAMGDPEWAAEPALASAAGRAAAHDLIDRHLSAWTAERADKEVMAVLQSHGVPAGYMLYMSDQPADPHLADRGYLLQVDQPLLGDILFEGAAFHASRLPEPITRPAPLLGEHTLDVWTETLGRSPEAAAALLAEEILVQHPYPSTLRQEQM